MRSTAVTTLVLVLAFLTQSYAQVTLQLVMSPTPSPYLVDWETKTETARLQIENASGMIAAKISAVITKDGAVQAKTNVTKMPDLQIPQGVSIFDASQIIPFDAVEFFGEGKNTAVRTGMLPAGQYQICVDLLASASGNPLTTQPACAYFQLVSYRAPVCLQPQNGSTVQSAIPPVFRWSPVTPTPQQPVHYTVQVFEVLQGQKDLQAFRSNRPILSEEVIGTTQLIWPQSVQHPDTGKLVWSVQAMDENGKTVGGNDGWAEPYFFEFEKGTTSGKNDYEITNKICGPDVTEGLIACLNRIRKRIKSLSDDEKGTYDGLWFMGRNGGSMDYTVPAIPGACPIDCPNSITLCNLCVGSSTANNIIYGFVSNMIGINLRQALLGGHAHDLATKGHPDPPSAKAAYYLGWALAMGDVDITREKLCDELNNTTFTEPEYWGLSSVSWKVKDLLVVLECALCPSSVEASWDFSTMDWSLSDDRTDNYKCGYSERDGTPKLEGKSGLITGRSGEHTVSCHKCKRRFLEWTEETYELSYYSEGGARCTLYKDHPGAHRLVRTLWEWTEKTVIKTVYKGGVVRHPCNEE